MLDPVQQSAREQFDRQSAHYGKSHILARVDDVEAALRYLPGSDLPAGKTALDVAAGGGHTGLFLAARGYAVTLADLSEQMLARASQLARERGLPVDTRQHSAEQMPYPDAAFDLVSCRVAPHHFSSPERFVGETARVLKPGGAFVLIDGSVFDDAPEAEEWLHQVEKLRDPSHHRFLSPRAWVALCQAAGLRVLHQALSPFKQPDLEWYFETAATPAANRAEVRKLITTAPASAREKYRLGTEDGRTVWWWPRLTLVAEKVG